MGSTSCERPSLNASEDDQEYIAKKKGQNIMPELIKVAISKLLYFFSSA
jgi:hypothetical protein